MIKNLVYPLDDINWERFLQQIHAVWPDLNIRDLRDCKKNVNSLVGLIERSTALSTGDVIQELDAIIKNNNITYLDNVTNYENTYWDPSWKKYFTDTDYKLKDNGQLDYDDYYFTGSDH